MFSGKWMAKELDQYISFHSHNDRKLNIKFVFLTHPITRTNKKSCGSNCACDVTSEKREI